MKAGLLDRLFLRGFYKRMRKRLLASGADRDDLIPHIRSEAEALIAGNAELVVDRHSASHLVICSHLLATYRTFQDLPELREHPLEEVMDLFLVTGKGTAELGMKLLPYLTRDPFKAMAKISKSKQIAYYGESFDHDIVEDSDQAFVFRVNRCFYHGFFRRHDAPELAAGFCAKDGNWGDAIDPARMGFSFDRPTTLARGGDCCLFIFRRNAAEGAGAAPAGKGGGAA